MILAVYIAMAVAVYYAESMLQILVIGAVAQCIVTFFLSHKTGYLKAAAGFLMIASIPSILSAVSPDGDLSNSLSAQYLGMSLADNLTWVLGTLILFIATYGGVFPNAGTTDG